MRRVLTPSSGGNGTLAKRNPDHRPPHSPHRFVHGPWNRKSIGAMLSQQRHGHKHQLPQDITGANRPCYGSRYEDRVDGGGCCSGADHASPPPSVKTTATAIEPTYSLWDLVSVGVGGTVGSGIFVLTGYINHHYAGPATFLSFAVSGLAALCSGISFAEFSGRLPRIEGSTYTYAYVSMGEYAAVLAASCLTLEYGVSGAAVARSWGDKVLEWRANLGVSGAEEDVDGDVGERFFNPLAGLISLASVVVLACGVQESKRVTNFFTVAKLGLVAFMIVGGFCLFQADNMVPLVLSQQESVSGTAFGAAGILRGATSSFFGYLGFDEIVCLAAEAKDPNDTSRAVLWTLALVTVTYILASIALSGMLPYQDVSDTSGFPNAFSDRGLPWAANLAAFGEVFTLPVVVLISLLAQPRLCAAMAKDGLLPGIFALQSETDGNLVWSNILCGIPMTLLATFVPFSWMDDAISVGILFAFNMTNTALVVMRCGDGSSSSSSTTALHPISDSLRDGILPPDQKVVAVDEPNAIVSSSYPKQSGGGHQHRWSLPVHLAVYHCMALVAGLTSHLTVTTTLPSTDDNESSSSATIVSSPWWSAQIIAAGFVLAHAAWLHRRFPSGEGFGDIGINRERSPDDAMNDEDDEDAHQGFHRGPTTNHNLSDGIFRVPLCPFLPLVGIYLNWYLISQLEWSGMFLLLLFLVIISVLYGICISGKPRPTTTAAASLHHQQQPYSDLPGTSTPAAAAAASVEDEPVMLRELSMPKRLTT